MLVRNILLITFFLLMVTVFPILAKATPDFSGCDINITNSGTTYTINQNDTIYCLNESIGLDGLDGINFSTGIYNTTLDCLGYDIVGNETYDTSGVSLINPSINNTIKNCNLISFFYGIFLSNSSNNSIIGNNINLNSLYGILFMYGYNNTVFNNTFNSNSDAISILVGNNNNVSNNILNWDGSGITLYNGFNNTLINNTLDSNNQGIDLLTSSDNILSNNTIINMHNSTGNQQGLFVEAASIYQYRNNIDETNKINGLPIYYADDVSKACPNNTIFTNGSSYSFIGLINCNNVSIIDSSPTDNILLVSTTNSTIANLNINFTQYAIIIGEASNFNNITNNTFNSNIYGIKSYYNQNNTFANNILNNNWNGIFLSASHNNTIINNSVSYSYLDYGIFIYQSYDNNITNNTLNSNKYGIYLIESFNNTVTGGSVSNSSYTDYFIRYSGGSNNFTNTNFTEERKIHFNENTSWFNYRNDSGSIWLKTAVSNVSNVTRELINWNQTLMVWNDTTFYNVTARYNLTGLLANTHYNIYNDSIFVQSLQTDGSGNLPSFTIYLASEHEIKVEENIDTPFSGCDINITNSGTNYTINQSNTVYCLNENINLDSSNGVSFSAGVQNTTLNCLGYNIDTNNRTDAYGVYLDGSSISNNTIKNCNITGFFFGINLQLSSNNTLINNTFKNNTCGIILYLSSNNTLINNTFNNNSYGIDITVGSNNTVSNNTANNNTYGIYLDSSTNNAISSNTANNNWYGIYLDPSPNSNIIGGGIYLQYSPNNTIVSNTANDNIVGGGILIYFSPNNTIVNNTITNNKAGIFIESSPNSALTNNTANNNGLGFYIDSSPNNTIVNNTIQVIHNSSSVQQGLELTGYSVSDFINNINSGNTINDLPIYYIDGISRSCTDNTVYTNGSSYSYMGFVNCNNITVSNSSPTDSVVFVGLTNSSISNVNISYSFSSLYFFNTSFSNITNCIASNNWYGIFLSHSNNNTLTNNTANNNNIVYGGIFLYNNSNNNTLSNNTANSNWYGIYILNSSSNNIKGGSIWNNTYDYYLSYSGATNSFNNTNFTSSRLIYFSDVGSWFKYANDTNSLWLNTNGIAAHNITRILYNWSTTNISWNESDSSTDAANYTFFGLTTNTLYAVSNNSVNRYTINSSSCGCINFTIGLTTSSQTIKVINTTDTTPPTWSGNITNKPSTYSSSQPTWMNITWNDNAAVSSVLIESNYSGNQTNYTPSQDGNVYYINPILGAGSYYWKSYGKDTSNNWNASANWTFTIGKGTLTGSVTGSSVTYPTSVNVIASESNIGDADVNYTFWRNGALISSANGTNPTADTSQISAGTYTYLLNSSGDANWTANSNISTLSITVSAASSSTTSGSSISGITATGMVIYINLAVGKANITANYITTSGKLIANIAKYQDVAIRGMNVTVVKNVANIKIMISKLLSLPSTVPYDINGKVYHYISVGELNFTDADIKSVNISFAVNKTWLTNNSVDASNITMHRWANNKWNDLNAVKVSDDGKEVFFTVSSPGLSVFIIGTKGGAPAVAETPATCTESWTCDDWSSCAASQQTRTCTDSNSCGTSASKPAESQTCQVAEAETTVQLFQVFVVIIVAIVIVIFVILKFTGKLHLSNIRKSIQSRMRTENSSKPPENVKYYYTKKDMEDEEESK